MIHHKTKLKTLPVPILITFLLSSFYLLPLLFERSFVQADTVAKTTSYALHFVAPTQLWNSTWGFGGSASGIEDGFSFKVGKIQLLLALTSLLLLRIRSKSKLVLFCSLSTAIAIFMSSSFSGLIWEQLEILQIVQFPWRFLTLIGFFVAILAGLSLTLVKNKLLRFAGLLFGVSFLLIINLKLFVPQTTFSANLSNFTSQSYLDTIPSIVPEYRPRWLGETPLVPAGPLDRAYYPSWKVKVDGKLVPISPSNNGLLSYPNPNNSSNVELIQSHTALEKFGYFLTILGLLALSLSKGFSSLKTYAKT